MDILTYKLKVEPDMKDTNSINSTKSRFNKVAVYGGGESTNFFNSSSNETLSKNNIASPFLYKSGDWFFLFVTWGTCCNGILSEEEIRVGRSNNPLGPYLDD